jgi:hypothetical protein
VIVDTNLLSKGVPPQAQVHLLEDLEARDATFADLEAETLACLPDGFEFDGFTRCGAKRLASSRNLEVWFDTVQLLVARDGAHNARSHRATPRFADRLFTLLRLRYRLE